MRKEQPICDLHIRTWLLAVIIVGVTVFLNTRSVSSDILGHVSSDEPPIRPGMVVFGDSYGWPWIYRIESFKTEAIAITVFDQFRWLPLIGNAAVGLVAIVVVALLSQYVARRKLAEPSAAPDRGK
jgi:hypothetical protein